MVRALIIEDNRQFRRDLSDLVARHCAGVEIACARDAATAWRELESHTFDIVFVDIRLPGESGLSLTERISSRFPAITKIVMTSYDLPEFREAALAFGADYFVPKASCGELERVLDAVSGTSPH